MKIGLEEVTHRLSSSLKLRHSNPLERLQCQMQQAKLMLECMGRLKGAAMKVGQMLSMEAQDFLPPEVVDLLSKLQDQTASLDSEAIKKILDKELGPKWPEKIKDLSPTAIAAASIGQVHSGFYKNKKVALKIQYPGITESIEVDLAILKKITGALLSATHKKIETTSLFRELEEVLKLEGCYLSEGKNLRLFQEILKNKKEFRVPDYIEEISTRHVLAMSFEEGLKLKEFLATSPSQELRNHFGKLALDLYVVEFFEAGIVQTDPNFANFLFRPKEQQLVVLDFGAVRTYSTKFREDYKKLLWTIRFSTNDEILKLSQKMGLISEAENSECLKVFCEMLKKSVEPFDNKVQPFSFKNSEYSDEVRTLTLQFTRLIKHSPPPHQLLFLHRKLGGLFNMLKAMDARLDLRPYWEKLARES